MNPELYMNHRVFQTINLEATNKNITNNIDASFKTITKDLNKVLNSRFDKMANKNNRSIMSLKTSIENYKSVVGEQLDTLEHRMRTTEKKIEELEQKLQNATTQTSKLQYQYIDQDGKKWTMIMY